MYRNQKITTNNSIEYCQFNILMILYVEKVRQAKITILFNGMLLYVRIN